MRRAAVTVALLALVAAGCGGTSEPGVGGASVAPASAPVFIALNTDADSSQWRTLDELASRFPDKGKAVKAVKDSARDEGIDWDRELEPALGPEIDLLWLDLENDGQNFLLLLQPDDEQKFKELMEKGRGATSDFVHEKIGDWHAVAARQQLIDRFRRESGSRDSLADKGAFKDAMDSYPADTLLRVFVDGKTVMDLVHRLAPSEERATIDDFGSLDWIASALRATSEGIRWDANLHGTAGPALKGVTPARAFKASLPKEVPSDALFFATFHGAKGMLTGLERNPVFSATPELRRYSNVLGRVEKLLEGENALYVRPRTGKIPEVTLVTEPARGTKGAATLDGLLSRYRKDLDLPAQPKRSRIAGLPARTIDFGPVKIHYADVGKRFVLTDFPDGIESLKGDPASLERSAEYKGALDAAGMPAMTRGFFYVNVRGGITYAERLADSPIPRDVKRNLGPLRSAVEYALTRPSEVQVTFFLRVK